MNKLGIIAIAAAAQFAPPAFAATFANASLRDFKITLFDLNPNDGIAPELHWGRFLFDIPSLVVGEATSQNPPQQRSFSTFGPVFGSAGGSAATAYSRVAGSMNGTTYTPNGMSLKAQGATWGQPGTAGYQGSAFSAFVYPTAASPAFFDLSPHTAALFSALGNASARTTLGSALVGGKIFSEQAQANTWLEIGGAAPGGTSQGEQHSRAAFSVFAGATDGQGSGRTFSLPENMVRNGLLAASFVNFSGDRLPGWLTFGAHAAGSGEYVAAVPEPGSYAMLLAGLGMMAASGRRRKARAGR